MGYLTNSRASSDSKMGIYAIGLTVALYCVAGVGCIRQKDYGHAVMWFSYGLANSGLIWYEISKLKES